MQVEEGFMEKVRGLTPEEISAQYLVELICRSLLQMVEMDSYGLPKASKMRDILRELAMSKSEEGKFCASYDERIVARREEGVIGRLSVQASRAEIKIWEDLQDAPIEMFPEHIIPLFNLRYLHLKGTRIKKLPESIGRLYNLETLDISKTQVEALPNGIVKLKNLKYLLLYRLKDEKYRDFKFVIGTQVPPKSNTTNNLQFLGYVEANSFVVKENQSMTQLVRLGISNIESSSIP
ncbi:hypothetical protein Tsubulata_018344 [Turnera subulata]|uniref:Uncharacterized protein n=1 Tax=Turnera subulata TaxID=218843 RepID=A0A9Q0G190_9ROSI|nr:hypothetical protein Tsubulata_018344 [Turnera subulata]